jgi:hypothetical protein
MRAVALAWIVTTCAVGCTVDGLAPPMGGEELGQTTEQLIAKECDDHEASFGRIWETCSPAGDGDPTTPGDVPIPVVDATTCNAFNWFQEYKDAAGVHYPDDNGSTEAWRDRVCLGNREKIDEWLGHLRFPNSCSRLSMQFADPGTTWPASEHPDPTTGLLPGGAKGQWYSPCRNQLFVACAVGGFLGRDEPLWTRGPRQEAGEAHPVVLRVMLPSGAWKSFATAHELCQWRKTALTHRFPRKARKSDLDPTYFLPH